MAKAKSPYPKGCQPPTGYLHWHYWAEAQYKAGLRQTTCCRCSLWKFPQEMSGKTAKWTTEDKRGQIHYHEAPICKLCDEKANDE